jgi:hypothetical protein
MTNDNNDANNFPEKVGQNPTNTHLVCDAIKAKKCAKTRCLFSRLSSNKKSNPDVGNSYNHFFIFF